MAHNWTNRCTVSTIQSLTVNFKEKCRLHKCARYSLQKLILSPIDSFYGITLNTESPYGKTMLNVKRPAVLRQYYGKNIMHECGPLLTGRYTYGFSLWNNSVSTHPSKFVTKPFNVHLDNMSTYLTEFTNHIINEYDLKIKPLLTTFNHCVKLLYISNTNVKKESSMGYHCDVLYNNDGIYINKQNAQVENTPTVIFTFGDSRILKWRRKLLYKTDKGKDKWVEDKTWNSSFLLKDCSITVINTADECPHYDSSIGCKIKYQHGVDKINTESFSVGYVFRVVNKHMYYCNETNVMRTNTTAHVHKQRSSLLSEFNKKDYHQNLVNFYITKFGIFNI